MKFRLLFILLHAVAGWLSLVLAFRLRFYFESLPLRYDEMLLQTLPWAMGLKALAADIFGLTRRIWRYASFRDVKPVVLASVLGSALFVPIVLWTQGEWYPNGPLLLDFLLTLGLFTAIRFSGRFWMEARRVLRGVQGDKGLRMLIVGAGDRGELAMRFVQSRHRVVGFLDADMALKHRLLLGVPVLGSFDDLGGAIEKSRADEVVIALENPGPSLIREIFTEGSARGCRVSLMPERASADELTQNPIRELKMSDFLGREAVKLDPAPLTEALGGMTVLVTGAGGSIGSELCRQISRLPVKRLLLLDFSETALFEISEELKAGGQRSEAGSRKSGADDASAIIEVLLCDIRFREDLEAVFAVHRPDVVYHAAACKHVPMMELHPLDAARTNVLGTRNVVELAKAQGVKRLLHVSTDKVVEAEGIMGASKAWGERIVRAAGYSCVRFGNVLGSSGSVIPLFEKQWRQHGYLRVTHADATRYFMTIEEAVLLILHAEALKGSSEVYILDMGEPVKILDLAKQMVSMRAPAARESEVGAQKSEVKFVDEGIRITGLRPGERVHERLHTLEEKLETTSVPKVNKLSGAFESGDLANRVALLAQAVASRDMEQIRELLMGATRRS